MSRIFIHSLADVQTVHIGDETRIWQFVVVLSGARIGAGCNLNCHTFVENDVVIGDRVTLKSGVCLWDGLRVEDDVFIGPNATFTNDPTPRSRQRPADFQRTVIQCGASIGAGAVILGGVTIGRYALIGAGSVVTKDVPPHALMRGNPARQTGWVDETGEKMTALEDDRWQASDGRIFAAHNQMLTLIHG